MRGEARRARGEKGANERRLSPADYRFLNERREFFAYNGKPTNSAQRAFSCSVGEAIGQAKDQAVKGSSAVPQSEARG